MGGCFSCLQREHDTEERQDPAAENLIENPNGDQPLQQQQQPGGAPEENSLCQSIRDFFKKCIFSRWCFGGFSDEMHNPLIISPLLLQSAPAREGKDLIQNNGMRRPDTVGENETSLQEKRPNVRALYFTREYAQDVSALNSNVRTGADENKVAGTEAVGNESVEIGYDGNEVAKTGVDGNVVAGTGTDDSVVVRKNEGSN